MVYWVWKEFQQFEQETGNRKKLVPKDDLYLVTHILVSNIFTSKNNFIFITFVGMQLSKNSQDSND